jgi:hypothetical protein
MVSLRQKRKKPKKDEQKTKGSTVTRLKVEQENNRDEQKPKKDEQKTKHSTVMKLKVDQELRERKFTILGIMRSVKT